MPHEENMSCLKREYLRKRNTISFSVNSSDGDTKNEVANFDFLIPPAPYPEHQKSQYGLFKLRSWYVINQTDTDRITTQSGTSSGIGSVQLQFVGSDFTDGTYTNISCVTTGSGTGATFNVVVTDGEVASLELVNKGSGYAVGDEIDFTNIGEGEGLTINITALSVAVENDVGGFYVIINGLGLAPNMATAQNGNLRLATSAFPIINNYAIANLGAPATTNSYFNRIAGGMYEGGSVACSNPMGSIVSVKVVKMEDGSQIANNIELESVLAFDIELLDIE
jgi:hypothetical protein